MDSRLTDLNSCSDVRLAIEQGPRLREGQYSKFNALITKLSNESHIGADAGKSCTPDGFSIFLPK